MKKNTNYLENNRLGRGLEALLGPSQNQNELLSLDIEKIEPNRSQPRSYFNKKNLEELADSIKKNGVLQPLLVEKNTEKYQIIAGERRWRAAALAGLKKIPVLLKKTNQQKKQLWALIENLQREDLSPIEEARAFQKIMVENDLNQETLAQKLGRSRSSLANSLRLLQLDKEVQQMIEEKRISFAQARELLRFKSPLVQKKMARRCEKGLTVKKLSLKASPACPTPFWLKKSLVQLEKAFSQRIKLDYRKGQGCLKFSFKNEKELKSLLNKLWEKSSF